MKKILVTLAISSVLFAGCGLKSNDAIIKVNNKKITQAQFDKVFDAQTQGAMFKMLGVDVKNDKNSFIYLMVKDRVVNELIIKTLLDEEIAKRGIKVTKEDVDKAIKDIVDKVGSKEQLDMILKQNGISTKQFKEELTQEVKMKKLAESLGSSDVTEAEAKKFYKENINKFRHPEKVRASHILISVNPEEIAEIVRSDEKNKSLDENAIKAKVNEEIKNREAKAYQLLADAKKDLKQFAKLAKENSDDTTSAQKGGDLGFFSAQEMVPEFSKAAFTQKPNTISDKPVKSQFGYHIIMVTDRAAAGTDPYEKVANDIKEYLHNQKQLKLIDDLTVSLKKQADIKFLNDDYNPDEIQKEIQKSIKKQQEQEKQAEPENKK